MALNLRPTSICDPFGPPRCPMEALETPESRFKALNWATTIMDLRPVKQPSLVSKQRSLEWIRERLGNPDDTVLSNEELLAALCRARDRIQNPGETRDGKYYPSENRAYTCSEVPVEINHHSLVDNSEVA